MTPTSVYAVSPRWDPAFVWHLVRATSTPPAPISKPVGSPPCDTLPRLVGSLIPPLSRKWRSGSGPNPGSRRPLTNHTCINPKTPHQPNLSLNHTINTLLNRLCLAIGQQFMKFISSYGIAWIYLKAVLKISFLSFLFRCRWYDSMTVTRAGRKKYTIQDKDDFCRTLSHPNADHDAMYAKTVGIKLFTT
jgi:hypothetical protein